jgi:hypothetical protein
VCDEAEVPHPTIIRSGRSSPITACSSSTYWTSTSTAARADCPRCRPIATCRELPRPVEEHLDYPRPPTVEDAESSTWGPLDRLRLGRSSSGLRARSSIVRDLDFVPEEQGWMPALGPTSAISRCSSRCPTVGRSSSCSR